MILLHNNSSNSSQYNSSLRGTDGHAVYVIAPQTLRIVYLTLSSFGFFLNLFTIFIIYNYKPMRKSLTNIFIISQSGIDTMASLWLFLTTIWNNDLRKRTPGNTTDEFICKIWYTQVPMWGMLVSSTYSIVSVTLERYLAVVHPIWHKTKFTKRKIAAILVSVWLFGTCFYLSFSIPTSKITDQGVCSIFVNYPNKISDQIAAVIDFGVVYLFPLMILAYFYIKMAMALRSKVHHESSPVVAQSLDKDIQNERMNSRIATPVIVVPGKNENSKEDIRHSAEQSTHTLTVSNNEIRSETPTPSQSVTATPRGSIAKNPPARPIKESPTTIRARQNIIKTLALVALGFVFCWSWSKFYLFMFHLGYKNVDFTGDFFNFTVAVVYVSCCINPVIYAIQYKQFQRGIKHVLCHYTVNLNIAKVVPLNQNSKKSVVSGGSGYTGGSRTGS